MRLSLFWKTLLGFWITLVLALFTTAAVLPHLSPGARVIFPTDMASVRAMLRDERQNELNAAMRYGGVVAVREILNGWSPKEKVRIVATPQGKVVLYDLASQPPTEALWTIAWPLLFEALAGLVFSAALAAYVTRPIGRLRTGFRQLAEGRLKTRLSSMFGRRGDEISDLGKDFDTMAERLEQLVSGRDRLLHDVSHELRSPLARMNVAVGLARQDPSLIGEALDRIEAEGDRLNAIIVDLLSLARAEAGRSGEPIYFDVGALLESVCADARFEAKPRSVSVILTVDEALRDPDRAPAVPGDPELFRRALENVIRNALRFTPAGSSVEVTARGGPAEVVIEVRDHGPGAEPQTRAAMFEPFFKGEGESSGAGLGLSIARRALVAHGGRIEGAEADGGGMLVRIVLPTSGEVP